MACIANISEQRLNEYKEVFSLHDIHGDGSIPPASVGQLLRTLGQNPTEAELNSIYSAFGGKKIDFAVFLDILYRGGGANIESAYKSSPDIFEVFNMDGSGLISIGELRYVLTTFGEQLTENEVEEFLHEVDKDNSGFVDYNAFVNLLMNN
ncbi:EF-hand [Basidiobolus meristosporus CBS 931.73]|uniref:EF-hand n=1 Tax=Basidiobolus meristosporus CBS 931.73 TaxID=1314790 RepID=A0A1Y1XWI9_9FUNG|nr:EF-hand [Basidiobolus meristosporus CBS 931.73]|eukprot:ORX90035.1 EF-hand [Basidiobolus meristosporus CBS 931.73]